MALKPVLTAWLEEAEKAYKTKQMNSAFLPNSDKKRKRTSIGAAEKRSLEAYFAMNPRPSSDKIASIAEKLDLSKNVVRVWFCNQRQKKKRMKFSVHWWLQEFKNFGKNITSTGYQKEWNFCPSIDIYKSHLTQNFNYKLILLDKNGDYWHGLVNLYFEFMNERSNLAVERFSREN